ncbi:MAG: DUF3817 domain-containing protein [Sphingobacteriales bacterium]|nr:MAG: DUF3817 domain-containing protein [Sphingobacteriales bacterium]
MLQTSLGRLRIIGLAEGLSLLVLLLIAMPLKYFAEMPDAVKYTGWIHGILFILFIVCVLEVYHTMKWSFGKLVLAVIAAFIPFGTFYLDRQLKKEQAG